jgi:hypothetical protein
MRLVLSFFCGGLIAFALVKAVEPVLPEPEPGPRFSQLRELEDQTNQLRTENDVLRRTARVQKTWAELWHTVAERAMNPVHWGGPVVGTIHPAGVTEPDDVRNPERIPPQNIPTVPRDGP